MKLIYCKPNVEVVELVLSEIIATSDEEIDITLREDYEGEVKDAE